MLFSIKSQATHNKSGEITYVQIDDFTIEATITTYTNIFGSTTADRDSLEIDWGDNTRKYISRLNGPDSDNNGIPNGEIISISNGIKENKYIATHTYPGNGNYIIAMTDPNRNAGILNINDGFSVDIGFHLETEFTLHSFFGVNNSPTVLLKPIDIGTTNDTYIHIPNAYDIDGDSLAYRLVTPLQKKNEEVPNYQSLEDISNNEGTNFEFDESTGMIIWDKPTTPGEYIIAIEILSYRLGMQNGRIVRDMQIFITSMELMKPVIEITGLEENIIHEVEVDDVIEFDVYAETLNGQDFELFVSSELFNDTSNDVEFELIDDNNAFFTWTVKEQNIRPQSYNVVVAARNLDTGIANYKLFRFSTKSSWTNIDVIPLNNAIMAFPNPCENSIEINLSEATSINRNYQIFNAKGELVDRGEMFIRKKINTSNLEPGLFFVKMEGAEVIRIVKK